MQRLFLTLFLFSSLIGISQTDTIHWDLETTDSTNNAYKDGYHIFKNGVNVIKEGFYKNNCAFGTWKYYHIGGKLKLIVDYFCDDFGKSNYSGQYIEYYKSGQVKIEGKYLLKNDSVECVQCFDKFSNQEVYWAKSNPSLMVGEWKEYYESGKLKSIGEYYMGIHETYNITHMATDPNNNQRINSGTIGIKYLKDNQWKYFNKTGEVYKIEYYRKGTLIGEEKL